MAILYLLTALRSSLSKPLLARFFRRAEILSGRLPYVSFAKELQRISMKLGIGVYTNSFFREFNFDFILPSVKHIVAQAYVKL
jgi:hypothetical protein